MGSQMAKFTAFREPGEYRFVINPNSKKLNRIFWFGDCSFSFTTTQSTHTSSDHGAFWNDLFVP